MPPISHLASAGESLAHCDRFHGLGGKGRRVWQVCVWVSTPRGQKWLCEGRVVCQNILHRMSRSGSTHQSGLQRTAAGGASRVSSSEARAGVRIGDVFGYG